MPSARVTNCGARSAYFAGSRPSNRWGGSTTWSSTLTSTMSFRFMPDSARWATLDRATLGGDLTATALTPASQRRHAELTLVSGQATTHASASLRPASRPRGAPMPEYEFVTYESLDEGRIARIMLNRPDHAQRPEPRAARRAERRVPARGGRRRGARGDPRRHRPDVLLRPRPGLEEVARGAHARAQPAPDHGRSTAAPGSAPRT